MSLFAAVICILSIGSREAKALTHDPKFDGYDIINGVDVSRWQTTVNWKKVKKAGVDFVIMRLGYSDHGTGAHCLDEYYYENLKGAKEAGLMVGVYYYSTAITKKEAVSEANYVLKILDGAQLDLPVFMDQECSDGRVNPGNISKSAMTSYATSFCDTIKAGGYRPGYYSYISWLYNEVDASKLEDAGYFMWMANVTNKTEYTGDYQMWQYSFTGQVSGIPTNVDLDVMYVLGKPGKVTNPKATSNGNTATISWDPVPAITGYRVYRADSDKNVKVADVTNAYTYADVDATPVATNYYVRSYRKSSDGKVTFGAKSKTVKVQSQVPYDLTATPAAKSITLTWKGVKDAKGYIVFYDDGDQYTPAAYVNKKTAVIDGLQQGKKYSFAVAAYYNKDDNTQYKEGYSTLSDVSKTLKTGTKNPALDGITLGGTYYNGVKLSWNAPAKGKVTGYRVYYLNESTGKYKKLADVKETTAKVEGLESSKGYTFMVRSYYKTADMVVLSKNSEGFFAYTCASKPQTVKAKITADSIKLTWKASTGGKEEGFRVYSYDNTTGKLTKLKDVTKRSVTFKNLEAVTPYSYRVRSYYTTAEGKKVWSQKSSVIYTGTAPAAPTGLNVSKNTGKTQTVSWKAPSGYKPTGYRLYSYNAQTGKYKKLCDITGKSFKVTGLTAGTDTHYAVRCYYLNGKKAVLSEYSGILNAATSFSKITGLKATEISTSSAKIAWTKTEGADGYSIYTVDKNGKATFLKDVTKKSYTYKGLKKNTAYRVQVRAFRKLDNKKYLGYASQTLKFTTAEK